MKRAELIHLRHYLDTGLKIHYKHHSEDNWKGGTLTPFVLDKMREGYIVKPILRPISDLTKEIELTGRKIIPAMTMGLKLDDKSKNDIAYWTSAYEGERIFLIEKLYCFNILFKLHFDVFGLIEDELAIDINTLK